MERDDKYFKLTPPILLSVAITLMKAALPKRRSFFFPDYQRLTYHLPTFNTHKRYAGTPLYLY